MQEVEVLERGLGWLESTVVCGEVGGDKVGGGDAVETCLLHALLRLSST